MTPARDEVWELKTYQLRIFGWFCKKDQFIAALAARKVEVLRGKPSYEEAVKKVINVRDTLLLDEPKFVGEKISNVLSGV